MGNCVNNCVDVWTFRCGIVGWVEGGLRVGWWAGWGMDCGGGGAGILFLVIIHTNSMCFQQRYRLLDCETSKDCVI